MPHFSWSTDCRYYVGQQPRVLVADIDALKHIMVKEFDSFVDRPVSILLQYSMVIPFQVFHLYILQSYVKKLLL